MVWLYTWPRFLADGIHFGTLSGLLVYVWYTRSCTGISGKTQILSAIVFTARYIDLFTVFYSVYNLLLKVLFLALTYVTVLSIYFRFKETNSNKLDTFRIEFLIVATGILGACFNYDFTPLEVMWAFSEYLEAVAIVPQLYLVYKVGQTKNSVTMYVVGLFCYRLLYFWHYAHKELQDTIGMRASLVQIFIYGDYFVTLLCFSLMKKLYQKKRKYQAVSDNNFNYPVYVLTCENLDTKGTVSKL